VAVPLRRGQGRVREVRVRVEGRGDFVFWIRCNTFKAKIAYKLDDADFKPIDTSDANTRDSLMVSKNPDHRYLAWVKAGTVKLAAGKHALEIKLDGEISHSTGIDCFVFSNTGFIPSGAMKPGKEDVGAEVPDPDAIWIEGEDATVKEVTRHSWYHGDVAKEGMSGKEWLSHYDGAKAGLAKFSFEAKKDRDCVLWIRLNPFKAKVEYKLDDAEFKPIDLSDASVRDRLMVSKNPTTGTWRGSRSARSSSRPASTTSRSSSTARSTTAPRSTAHVRRDRLRPLRRAEADDLHGHREPGRLVPRRGGQRRLLDKSVIDVSKLIPAPAGQFGFLKRDGKDLKFEKGDKAVKFWGICGGCNPGDNDAAMAQRARYYAKHGINMVRQHPVFDVLGR